MVLLTNLKFSIRKLEAKKTAPSGAVFLCLKLNYFKNITIFFILKLLQEYLKKITALSALPYLLSILVTDLSQNCSIFLSIEI